MTQIDANERDEAAAAGDDRGIWDSDRNSTKKAERRARRMRRLPADLRCPCCTDVKVSSRQWMVDVNGLAVCKACASRFYDLDDGVLTPRERPERLLTLDLAMVEQRTTSYQLSPGAVTEARRRCGVSQRQFAQECGWGRSFQRKLEESGGPAPERQVQVLVNVLARHMVVLNDPRLPVVEL